MEEHERKQHKVIPVGVESQMDTEPTMVSSIIVLMIHVGEEHGKQTKNATTGESIGIEATMGISILKSSSWSKATIHLSMVREGGK